MYLIASFPLFRSGKAEVHAAGLLDHRHGSTGSALPRHRLERLESVQCDVRQGRADSHPPAATGTRGTGPLPEPHRAEPAAPLHG